MSRGEGVADGVLEAEPGLVPGTRAPVEVRHPPGCLGEQARLQHVGEQVVVAVPAAVGVERDEEQVVPLEAAEDPGGVGASGQRVAERTREALEHRGREQEVAQLRGLPGEDLVGQVVEDEPVAAGKGGDEPGGRRRVHVAEGEGGELEAGDPALGAVREHRDVLAGEVEAIVSCRKRRASSAVNRRSAARTSVSWPRVRSRARGSGGSERVDRTRCTGAGSASSRNVTASCTSGP